jgi:hypothetical protein
MKKERTIKRLTLSDPAVNVDRMVFTGRYQPVNLLLKNAQIAGLP